jgi:predicted NACHT family NTPase
MSQTRKPRGVRATEEGLKKLQQAKAAGRDEDGKPLTYERIAERARVDKKTVERFFRREAKDRDSAIAITNALNLEITEVVDPKEWNPAEQTADAIDWHDVCGEVLAQQRANQRLRRQATERGFELNVYVPLGLVERKQQQRRRGDVPLEEVYQLTEEVITKEYDNDKFLTEVIEPGRSRRIAIIGEPGAGKTTLQEKIAVWLHDNNKGLPICIPLGGLQGKSLEDYLLQIWLKTALRFIEPDASGVEARHIASLQKLFGEGRVWLLLDGVDEMAATSRVEALATIKEQLTDWLVEARVVLTCRLNVWDANVKNLLTGFETYRTLEFKPEQVEDFIRQWFACAEESQRGEELLRKLQETGKERIRELVRNPLRLSLLCQTSYVLPVDEPLPETKAALYERFTRYFYEWKQEQHPTTRTERRQLNQALGELAKAGINSKARFRLGEDLACDVMGEPLFDLACSLGWLNLVDREAKTDEAVYALIRIANLSQDEETQRNVAFSLGQIGTGYLEAVNTLVKILDSQDEEICLNAASSLARIGMSYPEAINKSVHVLIKLLHSCKSLDILLQLPYGLEDVLSDSLLPKAVTELKDYLKNEVNGNNFDIFNLDRCKACYQIIWHCTQNMTYPDFYQAWHQPTIQ